MSVSDRYQRPITSQRFSLVAQARTGDPDAIYILIQAVPELLHIHRMSPGELEALTLDTFSRVMIEAYCGDFGSLRIAINFFDVVQSSPVINRLLLSDLGYDRQAIIQKSLQYGIEICQDSDRIILETIEALFEYDGYLTPQMHQDRNQLSQRCKTVVAELMQSLLSRSQAKTPGDELSFRDDCKRLLAFADSRHLPWQEVGPGFSPRLWKQLQQRSDNSPPT